MRNANEYSSSLERCASAKEKTIVWAFAWRWLTVFVEQQEHAVDHHPSMSFAFQCLLIADVLHAVDLHESTVRITRKDMR